MTLQPQLQLTDLIHRAADGDTRARDELFAAAYGELRAIASRQRRVGRLGHTMQATALANEFFAKWGARLPKFLDGFNGRSDSFFALVGAAMISLLRENHRAAKAVKRGGRHRRQELSDVDANVPEPDTDGSIDLMAALERLRSQHPAWYEAVIGFYFCGHSREEVATAIGMSAATVKHRLTAARSFLQRELRGNR